MTETRDEVVKTTTDGKILQSNKIGWAIDRRIGRKRFRQISDCKKRKLILKTYAQYYEVGCPEARATDPSCVNCEFNKTGQKILKIFGGENDERKQERIF